MSKEQKREYLSAEKSLKCRQEFVERKEHFVAEVRHGVEEDDEQAWREEIARRMTESRHGNSRHLFASLMVYLLYVWAFFLPCVHASVFWESQSISGWGLLVIGWMGWENYTFVPWSANLFWVFGLICLCLNRFRAAFWLGILASLLGLTTWWVMKRDWNTLRIGYYFWQASLLCLAGGAAICLRKSRDLSFRSLQRAKR